MYPYSLYNVSFSIKLSKHSDKKECLLLKDALEEKGRKSVLVTHEDSLPFSSLILPYSKFELP